ncbi:MAG: chaperone NapD [Bacteroidales bacterium]|nr:chaperone NapD [Bacteroidales bacterium]
MNISSIVVQVKPERIEEVINMLHHVDFCEYHLHDDKGRIIVTIEGEGVEDEVRKLKQVQQIKNVISADMVYSYAEEELEKERNKIELENNLPNWLNDDKIKAEDINYQGSIKGKL